jgi:hypothetical protein
MHQSALRLFFLIAAIVFSTNGVAQSASADEQAYVGTNQCFVCHRPQTDSWSTTKHANAFSDLPEKYRDDAVCLKCHATGFDRPGGYVAGTERDLSMVGCEACHGPGAEHVAAAQRFILADPGEEQAAESQIRATITKNPTDDVCIACHKSQAHQDHPSFEGQPTSGTKQRLLNQCATDLRLVNGPRPVAATSGSLSRYTVKTCGGCHYDQYRRWQREAHFDLAKMLLAEHGRGADCQQCHPGPAMFATAFHPVDSTLSDWVGVSCESCHGPALQHVRFNRRFISGPRLGAKLEEAARQSIRQGKPAKTCIQCHVGERHGEHPPIDKKSTG